MAVVGRQEAVSKLKIGLCVATSPCVQLSSMCYFWDKKHTWRINTKLCTLSKHTSMQTKMHHDARMHVANDKLYNSSSKGKHAIYIHSPLTFDTCFLSFPSYSGVTPSLSLSFFPSFLPSFFLSFFLPLPLYYIYISTHYIFATSIYLYFPYSCRPGPTLRLCPAASAARPWRALMTRRRWRPATGRCGGWTCGWSAGAAGCLGTMAVDPQIPQEKCAHGL